MTNTEMMAVILAHSEGKTIQYRYKRDSEWHDCSDNQPSWDFNGHYYRVKPEPPKPREFWINLYPNGEVWCHSEMSAALSNSRPECAERIHVREVLD